MLRIKTLLITSIVIFKLNISSAIDFSDLIDRDQKDKELVKKSKDLLNLYQHFILGPNTDKKEILVEIRKWTDQFHYDTAAFALITLNEQLEELPYDSSFNPFVNYEIGYLQLRLNNLKEAKKNISKGIAGSIILNDSISIYEHYITLTEIYTKERKFNMAQSSLNKALEYQTIDTVNIKAQILQASIYSFTHQFKRSAEMVSQIDLNQLENNKLTGFLYLIGKLNAIALHHKKEDQLFSNLIDQMPNIDAAISPKIKNQKLIVLTKQNEPNLNLYIDAILSTPEYSQMYYDRMSSISTLMYSVVYNANLKKGKNYHTLLIIIIIALLVIGGTAFYFCNKIKCIQIKHPSHFSKYELNTQELNRLITLESTIHTLREQNMMTDQTQWLINFRKEMIKYDASLTLLRECTDLYELINPKLIAKLLQKHRDLTVNDIKLASLFISNLETKEISQILNISAEATRKRKQRLKTKLNIETDEELLTLLNKTID